jgi:hypothetical protein
MAFVNVGVRAANPGEFSAHEELPRAGFGNIVMLYMKSAVRSIKDDGASLLRHELYSPNNDLFRRNTYQLV